MIAKINFTLNNKKYMAGDKVKIKDYHKIVFLNEKGFIEPLTNEELKELKNSNKKGGTKKCLN